MKRREFISLVSGATLAWPLPVPAQQKKLRRIGFISGGVRPPSLEASHLGGFLQGMRDLGYVEGQDFVMEWRFAEARNERFPEFAAELVRSKVDLIVTAASAAVRPVQQATTTIPIVMAYSTDPVGNGFVASLARPGGNITGLSGMLEDITAKQLELLTAVVPDLSRLGVLVNPDAPQNPSILKTIQTASRAVGITPVPVPCRNPQDIESAFGSLNKERVGALMIVSDALFMSHRTMIAQLALTYRMPALVPLREYVDAGGLMTYGQSFNDFTRLAASYVDRIFKGAKPGELPIQRPTRFYLVINLKTAKALGLTVPPTLLAEADEVIE